MNHIHFHEGCMIIKGEKSKTDQLRRGDQVVIAQSGGSVCPVSLLKIYLRKLDIDPHSNEFIFRTLVKTKSSYKLTQKNKPISYTTFRNQLAKSLKNVVPDPSVYGTHSFRSGGASRAANSGVNDRLFQKHGRWKSVAAKIEWLHQGRHFFTGFSLEVFGALVRFLCSSGPILFLLGCGITYCCYWCSV